MNQLNKEWENVVAVQKMQDYISAHLYDEITLYEIARCCDYSPWHAAKMFKQYIGKSPFEYIRALKLSDAALKLKDSKTKVIDVALDFQFDSHEGFTRAFHKTFGISPKAYQKYGKAIPLYFPSPAKEEYIVMEKIKQGALEEEREPREGMVYTKNIIKFPKRKLILKRGIKATNYFEFEEEHIIEECHNVWGILCSIKEALNEPMGIWLGEQNRKTGTSIYVQGVEVPYDYEGSIPEGFECMPLPEQMMMIFHSPPFMQENFLEEILDLQQYIAHYDPREDGFEWDETGYRFQFEPEGDRGYIEGRTIKSIVK